MKNVIMLLLMLIAGSTSAQEKQNTYYFNKNGKEVQDKDSADYIRTISSPESRKTYFKLIEYYKNGAIKRIGTTSSKEEVKLEGEVTTFYDNGKRASLKNYVGNRLVGPAYEYFKNEELKSYRYYDVPSAKYNKVEINYKTLQIGDSTGRKFLDGEGNGVVESRSETWAEKGLYKDGYKDGLWQMQDLKTQIVYEEIYAKGVLQSGTYKLTDGKTGVYTVKQTLAKFKNGEQTLFEFLKGNLRYPTEDKLAKITGSVQISFIVEADGSLNSFKVLKSPSETLTKEAIRVLQQSPNWEPALQRGIPIKSSYTLPILFNLR
ncbi:energy transducer TonB [Pedobacter glucosidilyticus]|uniref:energy transducer TonB n=1 Tax=Pedobacter glucosidilyticus TaxID=1122941 RepID=UPI000478B138|nr:energy transducer TonB [Pedobacter glucosidilyticus]